MRGTRREFVVIHRDRNGEILSRRVVQALNERAAHGSVSGASTGDIVTVEPSVDGVEESIQAFLRENLQTKATAAREGKILLRVRPERRLREEGVNYTSGQMFLSTPARYESLRDSVDIIPLFA